MLPKSELAGGEEPATPTEPPERPPPPARLPGLFGGRLGLLVMVPPGTAGTVPLLEHA